MSVQRRNGGRRLGIVLESVDGPALSALAALAALTRDWFEESGIPLDDWPGDVPSLLQSTSKHVRIIQRTDDHGDVHRFALTSLASLDLLVGVSSRRAVNQRGIRSENLATNVLLDLMRTPWPDDDTYPLYGELMAYTHTRLWRNLQGASHVQGQAEDWDIVVNCRDLSWDPTIPGSSLMGMVQADLANSGARDLIEKGSAHKRAAHELGISKLRRDQTHPALKIDRATREYSFDSAVVDAIREGAKLLLSGWTMEEVAYRLASRLPAWKLREEPDYPNPGRQLSRNTRNAERVRRGQPPVPLKELDDGRPNPDYRGETYADLLDPVSAVRKLYFGGPAVPTRHQEIVDKYLDEDLEGIHPRQCNLEFYKTGIYRRLMKDHRRSNRTLTRYRYAKANLGPVDDEGHILPAEVADELEQLREGRERQRGGDQSWLPLTGLFEVQPQRLYTRAGWIDPTADGRLVFRTAHNTHVEPGYRIYFEPSGAIPHGAGCQVLAWLPDEELRTALADAIIEALEDEADAARFGIAATELPTPSTRRVEQARKAAEQSQEAYEGAIEALATPRLNHEQRAVLETKMAEREQARDTAREALAAIERELTHDRAHSDAIPIGSLVDVLAALKSRRRWDKATAGRIRRVLGAILRQPTIEFDTCHAAVRLGATLELEGPSGRTLRVPVSATTPNHSADIWLGGVGGMYWGRREPFEELFAELGLATPPKASLPWRKQVEERLSAEMAAAGRPLRGSKAVSALARCPDRDVINIALAYGLGESVERFDARSVAAVVDFFFQGEGDVTPARWLLWDGAVGRDLIATVHRSEAAAEEPLDRDGRAPARATPAQGVALARVPQGLEG